MAPLRAYPVNVDLVGRPCLVVGGGRVALRKVQGLTDAGAEVRVLAIDVIDALRELDGVTIQERAFEAGDTVGSALVITATGVADIDAQVSAEARENGIWVNSADDPANCSFTLPAVIRRGDIVVTTSTSGRSPALATWLKDQIGDQLPYELPVLLDILSEEREAMRAAGRPTEQADWQKALDSGMLDLVREGRLDEAKERLRACL
jgi:precorrin-2 dehydrogenase/sirohydrochlorin ferrochelatase